VILYVLIAWPIAFVVLYALTRAIARPRCRISTEGRAALRDAIRRAGQETP
jgi:hypothetical protein